MSSLYIPTYHDLNVTFTYPTTNTTSNATVHYVTAGDPHLPKIILLHGFPSSSYEYRDLIPLLSNDYHVLVPDFPGFGLTQIPDDFSYTFANLAAVVAAWLLSLQISNAAIYIHDYGAPVGFRLAITGALTPSAIITQNGNFYVAGFGQDFWAPIFQLWNSSNSAAVRDEVAKGVLTLETTEMQYVVGTAPRDKHLLNPEVWHFNYLQNLAGEKNVQHQLDLFYDYRTNVELYPKFQEYVREKKVPILAVWGKGDPAFIPAGAEAIRADAPDAVIHFVDAGHFALESKRWEIARQIKQFLTKIGY